LDGELTRYLPVKLKAGQTYVFTLEETCSSSWDVSAGPDPGHFVIKSHELVRIAQNSTTLYDREICEIHHCKMVRKEFTIQYGMGMVIDPKEELQSLFPHYAERLFGGCDAGPNAPKTGKAFVCEDCKAAHAKWEAAKAGAKK
jgi:hypothetical protein